ncbi:hypothetical protein [Winogradskya humida]|uniref:Uncharacterized protein n=1 Tax=Winogradskya humida TaxID=113566 RepID=A0ABQ3ZF59_9ACTN|nr:hypothetical protein [Actinoplanes humidus]GIE17200.1 hypothetical protein Ahu01nite_003020 [Actinoplanes humidus]
MSEQQSAQDKVLEFGGLQGRRVVAWSGVEMALRNSDGPQFTDPAVPCLQLLMVELTFEDDARLVIATYQDGVVWGLELEPEHREGTGNWNGIYRRRALRELPVGPIEHVAAFVEAGVVARVDLTVDGTPLLLLAGEVYDEEAGWKFVRLDESVLIFTEPPLADKLPWAGA